MSPTDGHQISRSHFYTHFKIIYKFTEKMEVSKHHILADEK